MQPDMLLISVVKAMVCDTIFKWPVTGFFKQNEQSAIDDCYLTQLYADMVNVRKKYVWLLPSALFLNGTKQYRKTLERVTLKNGRSTKKDCHCEDLNHAKDRVRAVSAAEVHKYRCGEN